MTTLQQLQTSCLGLLFSTQAHKVGFARLGVQENVNILSEQEQYLLGLYDRLGEVCLERRVLVAELEGDGSFSPPSLREPIIEMRLICWF